MRWIALGSGLLGLLASLASCNTFDRRAAEGFPTTPTEDFGGPIPTFPVAGIGSPFGMAGGGGSPFFGGSGAFPSAAGSGGSGGGGWQLLDGGTPPPTPATDDSGADDAG